MTPYIIEGEWHDPEPHPVLGRRSHPYGGGAHRLWHDGKWLVFPSREDAEDWEREQKG